MNICSHGDLRILHRSSLLNTERNANQSVIVLGLTPPHLVRDSHEALYEINLGMLACRSSESAIAVEAFMKNAGKATEERFRTLGAP